MERIYVAALKVCVYSPFVFQTNNKPKHFFIQTGFGTNLRTSACTEKHALE